jgi:hypothetical protein
LAFWDDELPRDLFFYALLDPNKIEVC